MIVDAGTAPVSGEGGVSTLHLSVAGGLTEFGAYVETLQPGAWSSQRHWHEKEDEFAFVLEGVVTLHDDDGLTDLVPGDAVCWRFGEPNAHHLTNRGDLPCRYLIVGSRVAGDICHYPDSGRRLVNGATTWQMMEADGRVLREGDLPGELLGLPPVWGRPHDGTPRPAVQRAGDRLWVAEDHYEHPVLGGGLGSCRHSVLGDAGGLSQFGVHLEELPPGSRSSFRHWHEAEDEAILMLSGEVELVEDRTLPISTGTMACWPAGLAVGHQLHNHSDAPAVCLVIGTRHLRDVIHYPDHDLVTRKDGAARAYAHADGRPYRAGGRT